jgi:alpha-glucosidase
MVKLLHSRSLVSATEAVGISFAIYFLLASALFVVEIRAEEPRKAPTWLDATPLTKRNVIVRVSGGGFVRVDVLGERLFRIRQSKTGQWTESALNRYGILSAAFPEIAFTQAEVDGVQTITTKQAQLAVNGKDGSITLSNAEGTALTRQPAPVYETQGGYDVRFTLSPKERLYGLGDVSRENVMRRGGVYEMWVRNVKQYTPIPVVLSSSGWGLLMNTTWRNTIDIGKSDPHQMICTARRSDLDYYLFVGANYRALLDTYTSFTGRSTMMPIWGYALTFSCNQNINAFELVNEAHVFRREGIPCDLMALEPGWMSKDYDFSIDKKWHPDRFPFPYWSPKGPHTFIGALGRKGFKIGLWLCCDYDFSVYEEQILAGLKPSAASKREITDKHVEVGAFDDPHLTNPTDVKKNVEAKPETPKGMEPWFEHLKKFIDQGVLSFKLDGSNQVLEHPKREWGNGTSDEEMHNLYPLIYAKQMAQGFENYTGLRAMIYSCSGWAGIQRYVGLWAGDTGGGNKPLTSMLNLGLSGFSNCTCDMDVTNVKGIHAGFLQTWAQHNNWDYWYQPWLLEKAKSDAFREYARLRYRLLPYLYSTAAEAALTGYPVMRAMSLAYPDDPAWDSAMKQYMLGDFLLVSTFSKEVRLPDGVWFDFWTGEQIKGPATVPVRITKERGGALLIKSGAIIPVWPAMDHVEKGWSPEVGLLVYPAASSEFTLYEDDGESLGYRKGEFTRTRLACKTVGETVTLAIGGREGNYRGMPASRDFTATIHLPAQPRQVVLDGVVLANCVWNGATATVTVKIPACGQKPRTLICD